MNTARPVEATRDQFSVVRPPAIPDSEEKRKPMRDIPQELLDTRAERG